MQCGGMPGPVYQILSHSVQGGAWRGVAGRGRAEGVDLSAAGVMMRGERNGMAAEGAASLKGWCTQHRPSSQASPRKPSSELIHFITR